MTELFPTLNGHMAPPFNTQALGTDGTYATLWEAHHQTIVDQLAAMQATQLKGVTDGSEAAAGDPGEYATASNSGFGLTSGSAATVVSLALTAGDWDVNGWVDFHADPGSHFIFAAGIDELDAQIQATFPTSAIEIKLPTATRRYNVSSPTTVGLIAFVSSSSTVTADGFIRARRMR